MVPATVSMMMLEVLRPKSAIFSLGSLPALKDSRKRMFSGLRSRWVTLWLCSYCTPFAISRVTLRESVSENLMSGLFAKVSQRLPPSQYSDMYQMLSSCSMMS